MALYLPLLLVFVTGLHGLVERRGGAGADWSRLALAAGATLSAIFVLVNVLQIGLALSAGGLAEPTPAFELVWQMHAAAFALALPMLGTTFIGAALAAHASGLTPAWQRLLGLVGGSLLLAAGLGNLAIADGSALIFVGLLGSPPGSSGCSRPAYGWCALEQPTVLTTHRPNGDANLRWETVRIEEREPPARDTLERGYGRNL